MATTVEELEKRLAVLERQVMTGGQTVQQAGLPPPALALHANPPPLREAEGGVVRVGTSRISLDVLVGEYENGKEPGDIVREYDSLKLADVYGAIAYYLSHREEVQGYLNRRRAEADRLRNEIEATQPLAPTRAELLARQRQREKDHASSGL